VNQILDARDRLRPRLQQLQLEIDALIEAGMNARPDISQIGRLQGLLSQRQEALNELSMLYEALLDTWLASHVDRPAPD
jgi:hypothetical protein